MAGLVPAGHDEGGSSDILSRRCSALTRGFAYPHYELTGYLLPTTRTVAKQAGIGATPIELGSAESPQSGGTSHDRKSESRAGRDHASQRGQARRPRDG